MVENIKRPEQEWRVKLFTGMGGRTILDLGELLALQIIENKDREGEFAIDAIMTGNIRIPLTKGWFDSERKAQAILDEFQEILARRLKYFFIGKPQMPQKEQISENIKPLDGENSIDI